MPVPVTRCRHRIHREHLVAGRHQRSDEQAPVGLDSDHHLLRFADMAADKVVEAGDALHSLRKAAAGEALSVLVLDMHVVMGLSPIHPYKDHLAPLARPAPTPSPRTPAATNGSVLEARHPTSRHGNLTDQQGHDLVLRLKALSKSVLTCWRLSSTSLTHSRSEVVDPH